MFVCFVFEAGSQVSQADIELNVLKDDLELKILLPPLPECQDYRLVPPHLVYVVAGDQTQCCMLSRHTKTDHISSPQGSDETLSPFLAQTQHS